MAYEATQNRTIIDVALRKSCEGNTMYYFAEDDVQTTKLRTRLAVVRTVSSSFDLSSFSVETST